MKMFSEYRIAIAYLLIYTVLLLFTGVWLFLLSQGLIDSGSLLLTIDNIIINPMPKSMHNFIEVATPHMFAMGTLIFIVAHFMIFSTKFSHKTSLLVSALLFLLALLNLLAYLPIVFGVIVSGWIKLFSIVLFVLVFLLMLGMLAFSL